MNLLFVCCARITPDNKYLVVVDKFPLNIELKAEDLKVAPVLLKPSRMIIVDSFLIVYQNRKDTMISIFALPDCKYIKGFGQQGRGPEEFNLAFANTFKPVHFSLNSSFGMGNNMTNIQYYKIMDVLNNNIKPYKIVSLPAKLNGFRAITYFTDTLIIGAPYRGNMDLFKYQVLSNEMVSFRDYDKEFPLMDPEIKREVYGCFMDGKPDNSKLVISYGNKGIIEILNINNNKHIEIKYKDFPTLEENLKLDNNSKVITFNPEQMVFCWGIVATNKHIYARINNTQYKNIAGREGMIRTFIAGIHVFDWSGNPVAIIKPDKFYNCFYIDEKDNYLYTIDENLENIIRRYDLSSIL